LNRDSLRNILQRARKRAGITGRVYAYQLRHLCATSRLREGMREEELRELLGHRPGSKMLSVYVNLRSPRKIIALFLLPCKTLDTIAMS
jgi:site-specific recombinase XerD